MSRPGASTSFPPIPAERRTAPPARSGQTPTAGQALRALLHLSDDSILPALSPVDLARLHDLVSQTVFSSLVRTPSADGPPEPRLNWANESDPPAQPSQPFLAPDDPPVTPARPGSAQQLSDPVRVYIEHDVDEGTYDWQDVNPPLSARRGRKGPWTSQEGWVIRPHLPATPQTLHRPEWWPYPEMFALCPEEIPTWIQLQEPADGLKHLTVRGYCTFVCPCVRPTHNCYGLCLRPVHVGERTGHADHKCYNCLRAHAE